MKKYFLLITLLFSNCWTWHMLVFFPKEKKPDNSWIWSLLNQKSAPQQVTFVETTTVATPVFDPLPGTFGSDQLVSISTATSEASIYYTLDGSTPTIGQPTTYIYTAPIPVAGNGTNITIQAIATKTGMLNSGVAVGTFIIDSTLPTVSITPIAVPFLSGNVGAINTKQISWTSNRNGTYSIRLGNDCDSGTILTSGSVISNVNNDYTIHASSLVVGANTISICVADSVNGKVGYSSVVLTRDDTAPTVIATPGTTSSATTIGVNLSCSDSLSGCEKIVFTSNGTDPAIDGVTGAITNGTKYTSTLYPPDSSTTTYKYRARDNAGNVSSVISSSYTVDTTVATVSINSTTPSTNIINGTTNPVINWQATKSGNYSVRIGGTNCSSGTLATGTNVSGTYLSGSINTTINNSGLASGVNSIRICVQNSVGNFGSTTQSITKDITAPVVGNSGTITTSNITANSVTLSWTKATDNLTPQNQLQYKVVRSLSNNIATVENAEANGTVVQNWSTDISSVNVTGLSPGATYYFNVLVRDGVGNVGIYAGVSMRTNFGTPSFVDNHNGTVTDITNNRTWSKCSIGQTYSSGTCTGTALQYQYCSTNTNACNSTTTWTLNGAGSSQAYTQCNALNTTPSGGLGGKTTWRVPTRAELQTLFNGSYSNPAIDSTFFPATVSGTYWTSTADPDDEGGAYTVNFGSGGVVTYSKNSFKYLRCVSD